MFSLSPDSVSSVDIYGLKNYERACVPLFVCRFRLQMRDNNYVLRMQSYALAAKNSPDL